jgi:hypothetical protein
MDESTSPKNRQSSRSNVLLAATIELGGASIPVKLRNLSELGALIEGDKLPLEGTEITFCRNDLRVPGRIAWVSKKQAGVAFADPLSTQAVLRNVPQPRSRVHTDYRRPALSPRALSRSEQAAMEHWLAMMESRRP